MRIAKRVEQLPPYLFAELERKIEERRAAGIDVISLGIGDPDLPTPDLVVAEAQRQVARPENHQYPSNRGLAVFREAVADFYARRFGVTLDPDREVLPVLGGKEGVAHVCWSMLDPGDVCLAADPGYPVYTSGAILTGAEPVLMPLTAQHRFQPRDRARWGSRSSRSARRTT
jgi:LL-diaminopimelate aminotransferase